MIRFIDLYRDQFGVEAICATFRVTERGFITFRGSRAAKMCPASDRQVRDEVLIPVLKDIHQANYWVYGVRKMRHPLIRAGWPGPVHACNVQSRDKWRCSRPQTPHNYPCETFW